MNKNKRLERIERALDGVMMAVSQTPGRKRRKLDLISRLAGGQAAGVAATGTVYASVAAFGTAGTGTAIGTLSGAAATSATLAWIGGLVGGGMAAGGIVLAGVGLIAGLTINFYWRKLYLGRPKKAEDLAPFETKTLISARCLLGPLRNFRAEKTALPTSDELRVFAVQGLDPLVAHIESHFGAHLDDETMGHANRWDSSLSVRWRRSLRKNLKTLRKHSAVLAKAPKRRLLKSHKKKGKSVPVGERSKPSKSRRGNRVKRVASVALAVTFAQLIEGAHRSWTIEQGLVLKALRRSTNDLRTASDGEISEYLQSLSPKQLRGVVSNTKGIYHEILIVDAENSDGDHITAELMAATNAPGADIIYYQDGDVVSEVQAKAVASPEQIREHLERYPDIDVLATTEMAAVLEGIESSGFSNMELENEVAHQLDLMQGDNLIENFGEGLLTSVFVRSSILAHLALSTKRTMTPKDIRDFLTDAGIAIGTVSMMEVLLAV